ncbi:MAG: hypothetical protein ABIS26_02145 [Candidatus Paceibacterota bacterium]
MKNTKTIGTMKKGMSKGQMMAVGGAAAVAAAAGAGAYYLMGPKGKTHQRKAKMMLIKMRKEAKQALSKAKDMTQPIYHNTVDALAAKYSKQYNIHEREIRALATKLKGEWKKKSGQAKRTVKRSVKKVTKKAAPKNSNQTS